MLEAAGWPLLAKRPGPGGVACTGAASLLDDARGVPEKGDADADGDGAESLVVALPAAELGASLPTFKAATRGDAPRRAYIHLHAGGRR